MEKLGLNQKESMPYSNIQEYISLADKNWFKTGGVARFYTEPKNKNDFIQALYFAQQKNLMIFVLGQGANILISDQGFPGLVIRPMLQDISVAAINQEQVLITVGSGTVFDQLIEFCLQNKLLGLEEFSGIPGTVGGSVYINLHYYEFLLEQFLVHAEVIDCQTGQIIVVDRAWFSFGYDQSTLQNKKYFLVSATFSLKSGSDLQIAYARGRRAEIIRHRQRRYPTVLTCGSFFRNFLPIEVAHTEKKLIYVAYYLDKLGIKGELAVGDAIVSYQHANMIVNRGSATSSDIIQLAQKMQSMLHAEFGIKPEPECQLIGFDLAPLTGNNGD